MGYYSNCISLGYFCGTASSLSKLGLRNFSGPFDWIISDFQQVIHQIDHEFIEFMKKDNLEIVENSPKTFIDKKYKFIFRHDINENFEIEYSDIYAKYIKRTKRFIEKIKEPTCFFRTVSSEEEIRYIINHAEYIESILKRYNSRNSIVYILLNDMDSLPDNFTWFRLPLKQYVGRNFEMRTMFASSKELLHFCKDLLREEQVDLNRKYDIKKNGFREKIDEMNYCVCNDINGIDTKILNLLKLQDDEAFYIWGGGGGTRYQIGRAHV